MFIIVNSNVYLKKRDGTVQVTHVHDFKKNDRKLIFLAAGKKTADCFLIIGFEEFLTRQDSDSRDDLQTQYYSIQLDFHHQFL